LTFVFPHHFRNANETEISEIQKSSKFCSKILNIVKAKVGNCES
jgi:hypothetical protein